MSLLSTLKAWFTLPPMKPVATPTPKSAKPAYVPSKPKYGWDARIRLIRQVASDCGYTEIDLQENNRMISFRKDNVRVNVYYTTMTVGTCLPHPKQGPTQLFRKGVDWELLAKIFKYPRQHTGIGYQRKGSYANQTA